MGKEKKGEKKDGKRGKIEVGLTQKRYRKGAVGGIKNTINDDERGKEKESYEVERESLWQLKRENCVGHAEKMVELQLGLLIWA